MAHSSGEDSVRQSGEFGLANGSKVTHVVLTVLVRRGKQFSLCSSLMIDMGHVRGTNMNWQVGHCCSQQQSRTEQKNRVK